MKVKVISSLLPLVLTASLQVNGAGYFSQEPGVPSNTIGAGIARHHQPFQTPSSSKKPDIEVDWDKASAEQLAERQASLTESFPENLLRKFYVSVLKKTHVEVTEAKEKERQELDQRNNPIWHQLVQQFDSDQDLLGQDDDEGKRRKRGERLDDWFERRIKGKDGQNFRPWVILVSESSTDKASREVDFIFNSTLNILFPPENTKSSDWIQLPPKDSPPKEAIKKGAEIVKEAILENLDSQDEDFSSSSSNGDELTAKEKTQLSKTLSLSSTYSSSISELQFGHIKYIKESSLSWKFWIWKVPMMIFITPTTSPQSRSYDLRFYPISWAPKNVDNLLTLMGDRNRWFGNLAIWQSDLQMGGQKDWIPTLLADGFGYVYKVLDPIPSWILMMLSTAGTMGLIGFLHSLDSKGKDQKERKSDERKVKEFKKEVAQVEKDLNKPSSSGVKAGKSNGGTKKRK